MCFFEHSMNSPRCLLMVVYRVFGKFSQFSKKLKVRWIIVESIDFPPISDVFFGKFLNSSRVICNNLHRPQFGSYLLRDY